MHFSKVTAHFLCCVLRGSSLQPWSGEVTGAEEQLQELRVLTHGCCWAPADSQPAPASGWAPPCSPLPAGDAASTSSTEIRKNNLLWYTIDIVLLCGKDAFTGNNNNRVFMRSFTFIFSSLKLSHTLISPSLQSYFFCSFIMHDWYHSKEFTVRNMSKTRR